MQSTVKPRDETKEMLIFLPTLQGPWIWTLGTILSFNHLHYILWEGEYLQRA